MTLYFIGNETLRAGVCNLGASIQSLTVNGTDIVLGFNTIEDYLQSESFAGATMGRVANRIAGGRFVLNGKPYFINKNDGNNHLHGGNFGFDKKLFSVVNCTDNSVTMQYLSKDGEEGYPGNLILTVVFTVSDNSLLIEYTAKSDKDTLWCPTGHIYFNLDGEGEGTCTDNLLRINADYYTPSDRELIPTGEKLPVDGTVFDFKKLKAIGAEFDKEQLKRTHGYDHNYVLNDNHAAHAESVKTGIKMDLYTDLPCLQLYTGGALIPCKGKTINYGQSAGYSLEPQFCPNAVNMQGYEKPVIKKDIITKHYIKYSFSND